MKVPHIYIVGQTASGKTGFSLELCEEFGWEILNTDSLLFYKNLNIGTAKPSVEDMGRVKHHLIDICGVGEELTASDYQEHAGEILKEYKKNLLCVGGSGFYINSLDVGLLPIPSISEKVKRKVELLVDPANELLQVDPLFFDKISKNDLYRVNRALQIYFETGKSLTQWKQDYDLKPYAKKMAFSVEKEALFKRVKLRAKLMIKNGLIEEVEEILRDKKSKNWKPLSSVGYLQAKNFLRGVYKTKVDMEDAIILRTMQLAKRQKTWFKKDKSVTWFEFKDRKKAKDWVCQNFKENLWKV